MDHVGTRKTRTLVDAQVVATATATGYPTFPTGPDSNNRVVFAGDFQGCRVGTARWTGSMSGFTAADLTLQHSDDGENWTTLKAFTQQTGASWTDVEIALLDTDPVPKAFLRALVDMTGTPGTSTHTVKVSYEQVGPRGHLAPPGYVDVN